jgi:16S rRNA (adenine(1408)-N(1))-methyltransferase
MEGIRGTRSCTVDADTLAARIRGYHGVLIDIGTGDGRYIRHVARTCPTCFAIGLDACRENLRAASRTAPDNALFVIANALALPAELHAQASHIVVNFPWGSLLEGLLSADASLAAGLIALARPQATLEIRLNAGALAVAGWPTDAAIARVQQTVHQRGFTAAQPCPMNTNALRAYPSTWAKRLAYGRAPQAWTLTATYCA